MMIPKEHGAWGMFALPFVAGAWVSGEPANLRTIIAALAVLSVFLLRMPLFTFWRTRSAVRTIAERASLRAVRETQISTRRDAWFSLLIFGSMAAGSSLYLAWTLPWAPLVWMGSAALLLTIVHASGNYQRSIVLQLLSCAGLSASSLMGYLSASGSLEPPAFWIWALSAAQGSAALLVVHARLESIVAGRSPVRALGRHRRNAIIAQVALWSAVGVLSLLGHSWVVLPFLGPSLLHWWELRRLGSAKPRISLRRTGLMELGASICFFVVLISVLP